MTNKFSINPIMVLIGFFLFAFAIYVNHDVSLRGDEVFYTRNSSIISEQILIALNGGGFNYNRILNVITGAGFFVPGMSILLLPIQIIFKAEAPLEYIRIYMTAINVCLIFFVYNELLKTGISKLVSRLIFVAPLLIPYYLVYLGCVWGDLVAMQLSLILMLKIESFSRQNDLASMSYLHFFYVALTVAIISLIRPQYILLVFIILARFTLEFFGDLKNRHRQQFLLRKTVFVVVSILVLLAPWNILMTKKFGPTVMVNTMNLSYLAKDGNFLADARKETGRPNRWYATHLKLQRDSENNGISYYEQRIQEEKYRAPNYLDKGKGRDRILKSFYLKPNNFLSPQITPKEEEIDSVRDKVKYFLVKLNPYSWFLLLTLGVAVFILPKGKQLNNYFSCFSSKSLVFLVAIQPLVFNAHARYHIALIPLFVITIIMFYHELRSNGLKYSDETVSYRGEKSIHDILISLGQVLAITMLIWTFALIQ